MDIVIIVIIVIIKSESQRMSYNIHKITTIFETHAFTLSIMHCFDRVELTVDQCVNWIRMRLFEGGEFWVIFE